MKQLGKTDLPPIYNEVFIKDYLARQVDRGFGEILSIIGETARTNLTDAVQYLIQEHNIRIAVLPTEDDRMLDGNQTDATALEAGADSFPLTGMHTTIGASQRTAILTHDTLTHLNEGKN